MLHKFKNAQQFLLLNMLLHFTFKTKFFKATIFLLYKILKVNCSLRMSSREADEF